MRCLSVVIPSEAAAEGIPWEGGVDVPDGRLVPYRAAAVADSRSAVVADDPGERLAHCRGRVVRYGRLAPYRAEAAEDSVRVAAGEPERRSVANCRGREAYCVRFASRRVGAVAEGTCWGAAADGLAGRYPHCLWRRLDCRQQAPSCKGRLQTKRRCRSGIAFAWTRRGLRVVSSLFST